MLFVMVKTFDSVRTRNDGEAFHEVWVARRLLRLLDPGTKLKAVSMEGPMPGEVASQGDQVVDIAEYDAEHRWNGRPETADAIRYLQLKHSTVRKTKPIAASELADTVRGFATKATDILSSGHRALERHRFIFVANRYLSDDLRTSLDRARDSGTLDPLAETLQAALSGLPADGVGPFLQCFEVQDGCPDLEGQRRAFAGDARQLLISLPSAVFPNLAILVRRKAETSSANANQIDRCDVLSALGGLTVRDLLPAPPAFDTVAARVARATEARRLVNAILAHRRPTIIQASSGTGKTVMAQTLLDYLPYGSHAIVFDGFGGGRYRNENEKRHPHSRGFLQIANELAAAGFCHPLINAGAPTDQLVKAFSERLEQAGRVVSAKSEEAVVAIIVDAADNLALAAIREQGKSFGNALLGFGEIDGVRIIGFCRPERMHLLNLKADVQRLNLVPFNRDETAAHLRSRFASATDDIIDRVQLRTAGNPRLQATALMTATNVTDVLAAVSTHASTVDDSIGESIESSLKALRAEHWTDSELEALCRGLALLPPGVPMAVLAAATGQSVSAIESFCIDLLGGRAIAVTGDGENRTLTFRDEPTENWFMSSFRSGHDAAEIADRLAKSRLADEPSAYVERALPRLLYQAGRYDALVETALSEPPISIGNPLAGLDVVRSRTQYAIRAAKARVDWQTIGKAAMRLVEAQDIVGRHDDLVRAEPTVFGRLASPEMVYDLAVRRRDCLRADFDPAVLAAVLSAVPDGAWRQEARHWARVAHNRLCEFWAMSDDVRLASHGPTPTQEILGALSCTIARLSGPLRAGRWIGGFERRTTRAKLGQGVCRELLALGADGSHLRRLASRCPDLSLALAVNGALFELGVPIDAIARVQTDDPELVDAIFKPDGTYEREAQDVAVAALAEIIAKSGQPASLLKRLQGLVQSNWRYSDQMQSRNLDFRPDIYAAALASVLRAEPLGADDVMPEALRAAATGTHSQPGRQDDIRLEYETVTCNLLPWYEALALLRLTGKGAVDIDDAIARGRAVLESRLGLRDDYPRKYWYQGLLNQGLHAWSRLLQSAKPHEQYWHDLIDWAGDREAPTTPAYVWAAIAERAASAEALDAARRAAGRADVIFEQDKVDAAGARAGLRLRLAKAFLLVDEDEARHWFNRAFADSSTISEDKARERLSLAWTLADRTGVGHWAPERAHKLARVTELIHEINDHKFEWDAALEALSDLHPPTALASLARWIDRGVCHEYLAYALDGVLRSGVRRGWLSPAQSIALSAFGLSWRDSWVTSRGLQPRLAKLASHLQGLARTFLLQDVRAGGARALCRADLGAPTIEPQAAFSDVERQHQAEMPEWDEKAEAAFNKVDPLSSESLDKLYERHRDLRPGGLIHAILRRHRSKLSTVNARSAHLRALAGMTALNYGSWTVDLVWEASEDWAQHRALDPIRREVAQTLIETHARTLHLSARDDDPIPRLARLSNESTDWVMGKIASALAETVGEQSGEAAFRLVVALANGPLAPEAARNVLDFALQRLEPLLDRRHADGELRAEVQAPDDPNKAFAGFLWAMLSMPEAETRWRAAHAVVRCAVLEEGDVIAALMDRALDNAAGPFTSPDLPFRWMSARLYLAIALARAAAERPDLIVPHAERLMALATGEPPHVLVRHFAAEALRSVAKSDPSVLTTADHSALASVNRSPFPPKARVPEKRTEWDMAIDWVLLRYVPMDFDRYVIPRLGRLFDFSPIEVLEVMKPWLEGGLGPVVGQSERQPSRGRDYGRLMSYRLDHYPVIEDEEFCTSFHALMIAAGELLRREPLVEATGETWRDDTWNAWIQRHTLGYIESLWRADRRDDTPRRSDTTLIPGIDGRSPHGEKTDAWHWGVNHPAFDAAMGLGCDGIVLCAQETWGSQTVHETIDVSSLLIWPNEGELLLRRLQGSADAWDYALERLVDDCFETRSPRVDGVLLTQCGQDYDSDFHLDRHDPLGGRIPYPIRPGYVVIDTLGLVPDNDVAARYWRRGQTTAATALVWGDFRPDDRNKADRGSRLTLTVPALLDLLRSMGRDLLVDVVIHRHAYSGRRSDSEFYTVDRPYFRLSLLRADGSMIDRRGHRRWLP